MKKIKKYIPPECVDLAGHKRLAAQDDACVPGSAPTEDMPCWSGSSPSGWEGECSNGSQPDGGDCFDAGASPVW